MTTTCSTSYWHGRGADIAYRAMEHPDYPFASTYRDRHGKTRWRFRRKGETKSLPGNPGDPKFDARYWALVEGRENQPAPVVAMPGRALPETFGAAWRLVKRSAEWKEFEPATKAKNDRLADEFLLSEVTDGAGVVWGDIRVSDMKRRHVKALLADHSETPHKAKHLMTTLRKMIYAALDEEWIEVDPTYKVKWRPQYEGWAAWTPAALKTFEARWPIGSTPRLVYALALWLGNRRSDIATVDLSQICSRTVLIEGEARTVHGFAFQPTKGRKRRGERELFIPITPMLDECLKAIDRKEGSVVLTAYGEPFSAKSLTGRMADWTKAAGLASGHTLHGLRKTLGKMLAEGGASTRQIMDTLGHDDIEHAELYTRAAEQVRLSTEGMDKVIHLNRRGG